MGYWDWDLCIFDGIEGDGVGKSHQSVDIKEGKVEKEIKKGRKRKINLYSLS